MKLFSQNSVLDLSHPHVMGILNVTPDSFSDGGVYNTLNKAIDHVNLMINAGATIIDVGGESTRPGADKVDLEEEMSRVIPIIEEITKRFEVWISVDTSKAEIICEAAKIGVHIINDTRSLTEPGALISAAKTGLPICLMHMSEQPRTMKKVSKYDDIVSEVHCYFAKQIKRCERVGISKEKLLLDPGFGFSKNISHNYTLLAHLSEFHYFNLPLLVGMSRKSMIGEILNVEPHKRLNGSLACAVIAAIQGAHIIRAHDVKETIEVMRIVKKTLSKRENKYYE